jgi:hypothetical protein
MTNYGIDPRRQPHLHGRALPRGNSVEACEQRDEVREELAAEIPIPLHATA